MSSNNFKAEMEQVSIQDLENTEIIPYQNNIILEEEEEEGWVKDPECKKDLENLTPSYTYLPPLAYIPPIFSQFDEEEDEEEEEEGWVKDPECKKDLENLTPSYTYLPPLAYIPPEYLD
jgi:hypothetical protein